MATAALAAEALPAAMADASLNDGSAPPPAVGSSNGAAANGDASTAAVPSVSEVSPTSVIRPRAATMGAGASPSTTPHGTVAAPPRGRWSLMKLRFFTRRSTSGQSPEADGGDGRQPCADDMYMADLPEERQLQEYWKQHDTLDTRRHASYSGATTSKDAVAAVDGPVAAGPSVPRHQTLPDLAQRVSPGGTVAAAAAGRPAGGVGAAQWRSRRLFKLEDLERLQPLGRGFFSEVSLVRDRRSGELYALKSIREFRDAQSRLAFIQETDMLRILKHPNTLQLRGFFVKPDGLHMLTDYIPGGTLRKLLKAKDVVEISERHKVHLAHDIAQGMMYLHAHKVMHRDLKSKNCLLDAQGRVIICDFGLAKFFPSSRSTSTGQVGTPYWMAPEMLNSKDYGFKADVFSFGIVLCEIITRLKAAPSDDGIPRLGNYGLDVPRFREIAVASVPALVELAIECCEIKPENRPDFRTIASRLSRLVAQVDAGQSPLPVLRAPPKAPKAAAASSTAAAADSGAQR